MNPLFSEYTTKYKSIPFSKIKNEHFLPAFIEGIKQANQRIDEITSNKETPTFNNVLRALSFGSELLERVGSVFYNLSAAHTSKEIQKIAKEVSPLTTGFYNNKALNNELFQKIKYVYENQDKETLTSEQKRLLEIQYKYFVRNGANLNEEDKETLKSIDIKLSSLSINFGENCLKETNLFELHIENESDLSGLPDGAKEAAAITAKEKDKTGWVFTLDGPSVIPFITYIDNRALRQTMHKAIETRASKGDEFDNKKNIVEIASLRAKRAILLGYKNHADFVLEETMARKVENVTTFLADLVEKSKPYAIEEFNELTAFSIKTGGPKELKAYDINYYVQKLKKEKFNFDSEELKPYFKLENVINGVFTVAKKLYGIELEEIFDIDKYHQDVKTYKVTDEKGEFVALFYADFFPRESKQSGAWMNSLRRQYIKDGINNRPHITNVCNFTKPTDTKPSLLSFNEVTTLFHEFGHALHGILANTEFKNLSGTAVYRDFVELPSQVLENWCYEKEALNLFAFHYETGEIIPDELINKIKESSNFREASQMLRQITLGNIDMAFHSAGSTPIDDIRKFEKEVKEKTTIVEAEEYSLTSTSFGHIFNGGYSSGYYSYKWAEVLDADAFEHFKEKGIFNREVGEKFKETILSKGGTKHPMELYKDFRGSEPDNKALLKRAGLLEMV